MSRSGGALVFGWAIVGFFLLGGIAFTLLIPEIWIGQIWIGVALLIGGVFFLIGRSQAGKDRLRTEGVRGTARILGADQTGVYVNSQPQMKIRLRVEVPGITPFETEKRMIVPPMAHGALGSGRPQTVYVDRANHDNLLVEWEYASAPAPSPARVPSPMNDLLLPQGTAGTVEGGAVLDLRDNPAARAAVLEALHEHGVDAAHAQAAADPSTTVTAPPPAAPAAAATPAVPGQPLDSATMLARFQKLMELKNAQLITDEEFSEHKARILGQV